MKRSTRKDASRNVPAKQASREKQVASHALGEGRLRVAIEHVEPELDGGRYPVKRVVGDTIIVEADLFADGHDMIRGVLRSRHESQDHWLNTPLRPLGNDRWQASFNVTELGQYHYGIVGWVDHFATWQRDMRKRLSAHQDVTVEMLIGKQLIEQAAGRASEALRRRLKDLQAMLSRCDSSPQALLHLLLEEETEEIMADCVDHRLSSSYDRDLIVVVDRPQARFSAWYEMFPRSTTDDEQPHGTFKDCESRLSYIAEMGFDVLYLPPIHPIGETHRKGRNNNPRGDSASVGSPWAIGSRTGGHTAIHSELGSLDDFTQLVAAAHTKGLEIALDLAFQCSPDHPYVTEHPEWFKTRPDGTIQFAENPPKQYQDIFPLHFETDAYPGLWKELREVVQYWIDHGIRIFRVDNPHTKPFLFWKWLIGDVKASYPETIFLAEAFTRPKVMYHLAKVGFTQSYTYFAWRNSKPELTDYFTELTASSVREYFRPNLWTNTPDILTEHLQHGGRPVFMARLALAATLGSSYGIYGPAFELYENRPQKPGSEEYLDSEKYEVRRWDISRPDSLKEFIGLINRIRRENPALQSDGRLQFHPIDNDYLLAYSKQSSDGSNMILIVVNLSPHHVHSGWLELDLATLGIQANRPFQVHDLLTHAYYVWQGPRNYVQLDPHSVPVQIFAVRRDLRREEDFDYYL
ncbi:MAG: Alpha-1,4-glucan:maltose-1-phosphate maltosyltransferase [Nitrospira sp.]|nr:MAG: Alpha-1,4-glucan:maltose-1-phosphate maltosyltransferase [Nitrospira sp.]